MKFVISTVTFLIYSCFVFSQNDTEKYTATFQEASEFILSNDYEEALPLLNTLNNSEQGNANVDYKLGLCYLNLVKERYKAIACLKRASENVKADYRIDDFYEKRAPLDAFLYLGDAYKVNELLPEAEAAYKKYLALVNGIQERETAKKRIFECQMAMIMMKRPAEAVFEKLSSPINIGEVNTNVCISGDGKSMVFNRKMKFYYDILYATMTDTGWSVPKSIMTQLGSDGEFFTTALSYNGARLLLTTFNSKAGTDVYECILKANGKWQKYKLLDGVNSQHQEIDAVYSPDDKFIYFSSNRPDGIGGFDLYRAPIDIGGNIGRAENLGRPINTESDEKSPTFLNHGKTIVFSSQRKPGLGGFDYFFCQQENEKWGEVFNMGYPLSTVADDAGLSALAYKDEALLARYDSKSPVEEEIYKVNFSLSPRFKLIPVKGNVAVVGNGPVKGGGLYFIDNEIKDTVAKVENLTDDYSVDLYPGNFTLLAFNGTETKSVELTIPVNHTEEDFTFPVTLTPSASTAEVMIASVETPKSLPINEVIEKTDTVVIPVILFAFDKSTLIDEEALKLERFAKELRDIDNVILELDGFTDNIGDDSYNMNLSRNRALAVKNYLVKHGLAKAKIVAKGLGKTKSIARNLNTDGTDNADGRSLNRRVEIQINFNTSNKIFIKEDIVPAPLKAK